MSDVQPVSLWRHDTIQHRPTGGYGVNVRPEDRDAIIIAVAAERGVKPYEILGQSRIRPIAQARQEVMWRLRQITTSDGAPKHSFPAIAKAMGGLDHTTVLHAVKAHAKRLAAQ